MYVWFRDKNSVVAVSLKTIMNFKFPPILKPVANSFFPNPHPQSSVGAQVMEFSMFTLQFPTIGFVLEIQQLLIAFKFLVY